MHVGTVALYSKNMASKKILAKDTIRTTRDIRGEGTAVLVPAGTQGQIITIYEGRLFDYHVHFPDLRLSMSCLKDEVELLRSAPSKVESGPAFGLPGARSL